MATSLDLGDEEHVRLLYSYPNNFNEVGFLKQTLEETIEIWVGWTLKRDGFTGAATVAILGGRVMLTLSGDGEGAYGQLLPDYLAAGALALQGSIALNGASKWRYNWRFLLPHGLAMVRHRSIQLLHFPPDYVLEKDQDYLNAHTTTRWASLLVENGAVEADTMQYQTIIDIAPIAAPSDAGRDLQGIYDSYTGYITDLMKLWLPRTDGSVRPMVAFGAPVKQWLKSVYGIDLAVLTTKPLQVNGGPLVQVLGSNHPSFIYNAAKQQPDEPPQTPEALLQRSMRIMQQDLIAAGWQVAMAASPNADPNQVLAAATARWSDPAQQGHICELTYVQAFNKTPADAKQLCALLPTPHPTLFSAPAGLTQLAALDQEIDRLRESLGALDGREPDQISDA
ncbi:hypothetical protein FSO04_30825 [Paraburkholderia madseniana]|uniref:Uncharacterized protein n=1 Tax=Paraburkholderia madseniana TaxID=2599607 RepID=A0A6N6W976_9BURK|nr:hypothetical protein [Paraburkholderia madseniana]KAE8756100.1 hypothetical protein FSO04_30825 [Paraburkholderia madseniana]